MGKMTKSAPYPYEEPHDWYFEHNLVPLITLEAPFKNLSVSFQVYKTYLVVTEVSFFRFLGL